MAYSAEYGRALDALRVAGDAYRKVLAAYRSREIGDVEYLAGRALYMKAHEAFDAAERKEDATLLEVIAS